MHGFTIHSRWLPDVTCQIPSEWNELTGRQLKLVARISLSGHQGANLAKLFFLVLIDSLPWWKRTYAQWFYLVSSHEEDKANLLYLVHSFESAQQITEQKLPQIRLKSQKIGCYSVLLYGPSSKLANATFWEFVQAEKYYLNYLDATTSPPPSGGQGGSSGGQGGSSGGQGGYLNKLIATLYREGRSGFNPQTDSDIRIPLTDEGFKWRLKLVERMPLETKLAILMWFESCRSLILKSFPTVFPPPANKPEKKRSTPAKLSARERNGQHWLEMISELAGSMDRYEAIGNTNIWTALTDISHKIRKSKEAEQRLASSRNKRANR
jgi:hypothetical protein